MPTHLLINFQERLKLVAKLECGGRFDLELDSSSGKCGSGALLLRCRLMKTKILAAAFFQELKTNRVRTNLWALVTINYPGAQINVGSCNALGKKRQDPGRTKSKMTTATFCPFFGRKRFTLHSLCSNQEVDVCSFLTLGYFLIGMAVEARHRGANISLSTSQ